MVSEKRHKITKKKAMKIKENKILEMSEAQEHKTRPVSQPREEGAKR